MEKVLVDYHLAQGMAESAEGGDIEAARYKFIQAVFKKHHITEAVFDSSLVYYFENSEVFLEIYKNVSQKVQAQAEKFGVDARATNNQYSHLTSQGDTANIWTDHTNACIIPNKLQNIYQFVLYADSTYQTGDAFIWHFHTQYITQGMDRESYAVFMLQYENDSVVGVTQHIRGNNNFDLKYTPKAPLDTVPLRKINGFVYIPTSQSNDNSLMVLILQDLSMIRMHPEKKDTVATDSTQEKTMYIDTLQQTPSEKRLTPLEIRDKQPHDKKINVVKEKPVKRNTRRNQGNRKVRRRYQL
ncbi:MAG: DUF4296 domain-containing protein [Bacteroidaceae bacterium]|nr:DUF4296 domain-containing protein [Bacteroidaceae bacterium]